MTGSFSLRHVNSTSSAVVVNNGTFTVSGTGNRTVEPALDNNGIFLCERSMTLGDTSPLTASTNSGRMKITSGETLTVRGGLTNEPGGVIGGNATMNIAGASSFLQNGELSPGESIGTLTISGNLNCGATAGFPIEIGPGGNDLLLVNGTLGLNGTLRPRLIGGYVQGPGDTFVVIDSTGVLSGGFTSIEQPFSTFGSFVAQLDPVLGQVTPEFQVTGPLNFGDFQKLYFTDAQILAGDADAGVDFDGDGVSNRLEWITGTDPTDPSSRSGAPTMVKNGDGSFDLTCQKSTLLPPLQIDLVSTSDLLTWPTVAPGNLSNQPDVPHPSLPNVVNVTLRISGAPETTTPRRFFRVRFTDLAP
jgi:hypothetical protein